MHAGWSSLARRPAGTLAIAGLAQAAVLWVVLWFVHSDLILLVVLEIVAGSLVALVAGGWPAAMAGALMGGTVVATANTSLTAGQVGWGFAVALSVALLLFTPGYLLGRAYGAFRDARAAEISPTTMVVLAGLILAADAAIVIWVVATFRLPGQ